MKLLKPFFLLLYLFACLNAAAQNPASQAELDEITRRGKMLYEYDLAAWHSTDAVLALAPPENSFTGYVAQKTDKGWVVAYGRLNDKKDRYLIVYEAVQGATPKEFKVSKFEKPKEDAGFFLKAARARETAGNVFRGEDRPYNVAVLPAASNEFFVYVMPAQTELEVFPLGGDVRYKISADGTKIIETRQMHRSIIEFRIPPPNVKPATGFHTAILDDVPEDSDVFHVLTRNLSLPELVVTNKFVYNIAADGSIKYVMTREAFTKIGNNQK